MHNDNRAPGRAPRIALAVGDTAGHAYPALAVAEAFRERHPDSRILFLGTADSMAAGILAREGEALIAVPAAPIRRAGLAGAARAVAQTIAGMRAARRVLAQHAVTQAIGFGGFASGGVLLAARWLGIPTAIHEANVEPGLANSWLRRFVDEVYLTHAGTLPGGIAVGLPIRAEMARLATLARTPPAGRLRLLVMSGSRGAGFLADAMPPVVMALGSRGIDVAIRQQPPAGFMTEMAEVYRWADAAISRAGAGSVAELAAAGLPALLVPLADAAADHQAANARRWQAAGAGPLVVESRWDPAFVAEWLGTLATDPDSWRQAAGAARSLAQPDAARRMVEHCAAR